MATRPKTQTAPALPTTPRVTVAVPAARASQQRGEAVIQAVLEATTEELGRVGYGAMRFEDVACRAGVAKTTIYRRWPTKRELVEDALSTIADGMLLPPQTGQLRSDLVALGATMVKVLGSAKGQAIVRMMTAEDADPELITITRCLRDDTTAPPRQVIVDAVARGELRSMKRGELLLETMMGAIHHRVFLLREPPDAEQLQELVDLLLDGALLENEPCASVRRARRAPPTGDER